MTASAYALTKAVLQGKYDRVIQAGIAGALDYNLQLGEVVQVVSDSFGQLGAEDGEEFISVFQLGFMDPNQHPFQEGTIQSPTVIDELKSVKGTTVETVHGNHSTIQQFQQRSFAQVETMEGAACAYVCAKEGLPFLQIRAISNYVERRNREAWNIPLAIKALNQTLIQLVS